jgi:hypothetical protein
MIKNQPPKSFQPLRGGFRAPFYYFEKPPARTSGFIFPVYTGRFPSRHLLLFVHKGFLKHPVIHHPGNKVPEKRPLAFQSRVTAFLMFLPDFSFGFIIVFVDAIPRAAKSTAVIFSFRIPCVCAVTLAQENSYYKKNDNPFQVPSLLPFVKVFCQFWQDNQLRIVLL